MDNEQHTRALNALCLSETRMVGIRDKITTIQVLLEDPTEEATGLFQKQMENLNSKLKHAEKMLQEAHNLISEGIKNLEKREAK